MAQSRARKTAKIGQNGARKCRLVSLGVTWPGVWRLLDLVVGATSPSPPRLPAPDRRRVR